MGESINRSINPLLVCKLCLITQYIILSNAAFNSLWAQRGSVLYDETFQGIKQYVMLGAIHVLRNAMRV